MAERELPVRLELKGAAPRDGTVHVVDRSPGARVGRALVGLLACWAPIAIAIFIPLLHFVLVPGLLVGGVVLAVLRLREAVSLVGARGVCPRCEVERAWPGGGRLFDGRELHCDGCGCGIGLRLSR